MITNRRSPLPTAINSAIYQIVIGSICQPVKNITDNFPVYQVFRSHNRSTRHQMHSGTHHIKIISDSDYIHIRNIGVNNRISES